MPTKQDQVAKLIKRCKFQQNEIRMATNGECMWFAVALHNIITDQGIKAGFAVAATEMNSWCHVLVRQAHGYYDIQGRVFAKSIHAQFQSSRMLHIDREQLFEAYKLQTKNPNSIIRKWQRRIDADAP